MARRLARSVSDTVLGWIPGWGKARNDPDDPEIVVRSNTSTQSAPVRSLDNRVMKSSRTGQEYVYSTTDVASSGSESEQEVRHKARNRNTMHSTPVRPRKENIFQAKGDAIVHARTRTMHKKQNSKNILRKQMIALTESEYESDADKENQISYSESSSDEETDLEYHRRLNSLRIKNSSQKLREKQGLREVDNGRKSIRKRKQNIKNPTYHARERSFESNDAASCTERVAVPYIPTQKPAFKKVKDPKSFDGIKIEWRDYLKHFQAVSEWNGWNSEQKAKQLVMSFEGEALKLFGELSDEVMNNFELLVAELNRRYDPAERAQAWKIEFRNRMRNPNETVTQFAQVLKRLCVKAFPGMNMHAQEQWVLDQFSLGLGNVDLQKHVQFAHPIDLNAAISLAVEYEAFEAGTRDKYKKPQIRSGEIYAVTSEQNPFPIIQYQSNHSANNQASRGNGNSYQQNLQEIECYYCRKAGHFKRDCPKLKDRIERETTTFKTQGN